MTNKEYLARARELTKSINANKALLDAMTGYRSVEFGKDKIDSGSGNSEEAARINHITLEAKIHSDIVERSKALKEIYDSIMEIEKDDYRNILLYIYIAGFTQRQVADKMHYSKRSVQRKLKVAEGLIRQK